MSRSPLIIAHRGASAHAPENTLAAFLLALEAGADGVEFDVQLAKNGVPAVIHNATLTRTGLRNERVADLTSLQLAKIDVGAVKPCLHSLMSSAPIRSRFTARWLLMD